MMGEKVVIAMKGHPGTGKSTLASAIATTFRIPLVDKDDVKDSTFPLSRLIDPSQLNDLSYNATWQIASTQLRLGLSVVVDSPLSCRAHLDRLLHVASGGGARVMVIECRPSDEDEWRGRLESRGRSDRSSWHKPSAWGDVEKLLEGYGGCTEYDVGDVPKLVVDTTGPVGTEDLVRSVIDFIVANGGPSPSRGLPNSDYSPVNPASETLADTLK